MKLKKGLGLLDVFCICTGAMLSGVFILPGLAHAQAGPAVLFAYVIAGLLASTGMLSQAELASAMPKAGGAYFFISRSMGSGVGTVYGLITWLSLSLKSAYELLAIATFSVLLIQVNVHVMAITFCAVFVGINILGVKEAGKIQIVLVLGLFAALLFYVIRGAPAIDIHNYQPFMPEDSFAIVATAGFVFVSFGGLLKVASIAEEVKDPGKVIPLAMILSLIAIVLIYLAVVFVTIGVFGGQDLNRSLAPISDSAAVFMGGWGKAIFGIAAILSIVSSSNAGIMAASRYPMALGRDRLFPPFLGKTSKRFQTPHYSTLITGAIIIGSMFLDIKTVVKAASSVLILTYAFSCLANIVLRESRLQNYRPRFRTPLYPWTPIIGMIGFTFLLLKTGKEPMLIIGGLIVAGLLVYLFYGRISANREFALLHLVERVTAKDMTSHSLETELKEIIRERDEIEKDRFDHIIEDCEVLDIDEKLSLEEFFKIAAQAMAGKARMDPDTLCKLLLEREKSSTTALSPYFSIPHVVIEGEHTFLVLLARCKEGVVFEKEKAPRVHAVFFLLGSLDERHFHLHALSAIAQIVQHPQFERRWREAKSKEALRDIFLLGKRVRHLRKPAQTDPKPGS